MNEYVLQPIAKTLDDKSWDCTEYKGEDGPIVVVADSESQARFMCELATLKLIKRGLEHRGSPWRDEALVECKTVKFNTSLSKGVISPYGVDIYGYENIGKKKKRLFHNYTYDPNKTVYFNAQEKKVFSREYVEDQKFENLFDNVFEKSSGQWSFYFNASLTKEKREAMINYIESSYK